MTSLRSAAENHDARDVSAWLRHSAGSVDARVRLLCFPHAGGGASSFNAWRAELPDWIELVKVQLPGREDRRSSPPHTNVGALVAELFPRIEAILDKPLAIYGHSMGALIAFEVTRALRRSGHAPPLALLISSRRAPHRPLRDVHVMHSLPEDAFAARVEQLGGLPPGLLASVKWRNLYLPTIRADLHLSDVYTHQSEPPLDCPLHTFIGEVDNLVVREDWEAWEQHTAGEFTRRVLPGGHFFSKPAWKTLITDLSTVVETRLGRAAQPHAIESRARRDSSNPPYGDELRTP